MRIGLIGCSYHWGMYAQALKDLPQACVVGVSAGSDTECMDTFAEAPGVDESTPRFASPLELLDRARPDVVQVSTAFECMGTWVLAAAERGIPVLAEKPIAMDLETLCRLAEVAHSNHVPIYAVQGMHGHRAFTAAQQVIAGGKIGIPYISYHQKSYQWGSRPDTWKQRATFPGLVPWVGIHALAWMQWVLGDALVEVSGYEGHENHPDYPACATQAGLVFRTRNDGVALLSIDYLRPKGAPTHGDERMRVAGSLGVVEVFANDDRAVLITQTDPPREIQPEGELMAPVTRFCKSLAGMCCPPATTGETLRVTEIALLAQQAVEQGRPLTLVPSRVAF